jgi:hypothetical protein
VLLQGGRHAGQLANLRLEVTRWWAPGLGSIREENRGWTILDGKRPATIAAYRYESVLVGIESP